jgi:hypothetical protein
MKTATSVALGVLLGTATISTFAIAQTSSSQYDSTAPRTRAQVAADFLEWHAAGFKVFEGSDYPENAQRAGRIVAERRAQAPGQLH